MAYGLTFGYNEQNVGFSVGKGMMISAQSYRAHWIEREKQEAEMYESRRLEACRAATKLAGILADEYSAKKVVLFGSCTAPNCFSSRSDIDLAVQSLPKERFYEALGRLNAATHFHVDLKPIDEVRELLRRRIEKGIVLYEAGKNT